MTRVLGLDIGTSAVKAVLLEPATGRTVSARSVPYAMDTPAPGWFEQSPAVWLRAVREAVAGLGEPGVVEAIGFSGQMHGAVLAGVDGEAVRPAMLWPDRRAEAEAAEIAAVHGSEAVYRATGSPSTANSVLPKLLWLQRHEPEALAAAHGVLLPKDWVRLQLGGAWATDPTDASGTGALALETLQWDAGLLGAVPARLLPEVVPSASVAGRLNIAWARLLGLREGTPLAAGAGDLPAAVHAAGAEGRALLNVGSAGQVAVTLPAGADWPTGAQAFAHPDPARRIAVGALLAAGLAVAWARGRLGGAEALPPAHVPEVVFVPHLAGERIPSYDLRPRGAWLGLGLDTGAREMVSAALYGVAMAYRQFWEHMTAVGERTRPLVLAEGAYAADWAERLANTLGCDLDLMDAASPSGLGAAMLGAAAVGLRVPRTGASAPVQCDPVAAAAAERVYGEYRRAVGVR